MKTKLNEFFRDADFTANSTVSLVAYELTHDGEGWSVNTPFFIASDVNLTEAIRIAQARGQVFKINYAPRAKLNSLIDISDVPGLLEIEYDGIPFLRIIKNK